MIKARIFQKSRTKDARKVLLSALFSALLMAVPSLQAALAPPTGRVLLIVDGNIDQTNVGDELHLDMEALRALPAVSFRTLTPWTEDQWLEFRGTSLKALLEAAGAGSDAFTAVGVDDYAAEFQDIDLEKYPVMIAFEQDGKLMSLRQLGPLRVIFPFSDFPELDTESSKAMAVWQLVRMTVH